MWLKCHCETDGERCRRGVLKLKVVNTRTALLEDGVVVVRRQGDGPEEKGG